MSETRGLEDSPAGLGGYPMRKHFSIVRRCRVLHATLLLVCVLGVVGCGSQRQQVYQNDQLGFRFLPPTGWSERSKDETAAGAGQEQRLAQYKRLTAGRPAWLRLTVASAGPSATPAAVLSKRAPGKDWRVESPVESLEINGQTAARVAYAGRWRKADYLCEIVAVHQGDRMYFFTASFPADDNAAREDVRKSLATCNWQATATAVAAVHDRRP